MVRDKKMTFFWMYRVIMRPGIGRIRKAGIQAQRGVLVARHSDSLLDEFIDCIPSALGGDFRSPCGTGRTGNSLSTYHAGKKVLRDLLREAPLARTLCPRLPEGASSSVQFQCADCFSTRYIIAPLTSEQN
jgi:hypothetical protein